MLWPRHACLHLICRFASRFTQIREVLIRGLVLYYIAAQVFVNTPNALLSGKVPFYVMHQPTWLARYSNTSPLLTTTFGFMVSRLSCSEWVCLGVCTGTCVSGRACCACVQPCTWPKLPSLCSLRCARLPRTPSCILGLGCCATPALGPCQ